VSLNTGVDPHNLLNDILSSRSAFLEEVGFIPRKIYNSGTAVILTIRPARAIGIS
jgi:hypothetical protein